MSPNRVISMAEVKGPVRKKQAWNLIKDYDAYSRFIPCIDESTILQRSAAEGKSEWFATIGESAFHWVQKDHFDEDNFIIHFEALTGDLSTYTGKWKISNRKGGGICIRLEVLYHLDIPVIESMLGDVLSEKMQSHIEILTGAIRSELENSAVEHRQYPRTSIQAYNDIRVEDRFLRSYVTDISLGGIAFFYHPGFDAIYDKLYLGSLSLPIKDFLNSMSDNCCRIVFSRPLLEEEFRLSVNRLHKTNVRQYRRHVIGKDMVFRSRSEQFTAQLVNVSEGGLQMQNKSGLQKLGDFIEIGGQQISIRKQIHDRAHNSTRVEFAQAFPLHDILQLIQHPA